MDIWIIYGLFIHFLIIVLLILIEHLPNQANVVFIDEDKRRSNQRPIKSKQQAVKTFAQKILPAFELVFVISYFISGCIIYIAGF